MIFNNFELQELHEKASSIVKQIEEMQNRLADLDESMYISKDRRSSESRLRRIRDRQIIGEEVLKTVLAAKDNK